MPIDPATSIAPAADILRFWFGDSDDDDATLAHGAPLWFTGGEGVDAEIRRLYGASIEAAARGELEAWRESPSTWLALLILLDQFPRNLHRNSARAFASDALAQRVLLDGIQRGHDRALSPARRVLAYMPLQHAENRSLQAASVALFDSLSAEAAAPLRAQFDAFAGYARRHRDVIDIHGRFPHRNAVLGRESSADELEHLARHPTGF